ncbi:hemin-degrading factor [Iodidimonas nitroreducens]|uniref:Hemin-degrading factor n=1 Tax=Iodidimonas nitroreducens TaxID=1236968 RepID=A0A5A7N5T7_9PROT|nr:hemin-degrading factor [Iodidimonas nitroreducens]GAK32451.1 hemin transport protein HmuS [alpha proteobacterium Q-1]GER02780.1 hemin-degrading factor [Iodidimonas nitroreducens]
MATASKSLPLEAATHLKMRWQIFQSTHPNIRIRQAARELGASEAELLATAVGESAIRLAGDWGQLIKSLPALGDILCITRNDHAVHEKTGRFGKISISPGHALVVNRAIDLRIFFSHWHHGFAVTETTRKGPRRSLQFFDLAGTSVHKIYLGDTSDQRAYDDLVARFSAEDQRTTIETASPAPMPPEIPDRQIKAQRLRQHWLALQDTHDFIDLLRDFGVRRQQAFRLVGPDLAFPLGADAFRTALKSSAASQLPIMIFVGNKGCIQIHSGPITRIVDHQGWLNILDPGFNLHVREDAIARAWVVRKPTRDGIVTSLELFDAKDQPILSMFGERKPGEQERSGWTDLCAALIE